MVNAKTKKPSSLSSPKDLGKHDEILNPCKSPNSDSSYSDDDCHYKADGFYFIGSNNLDKSLGSVNQMLKDIKLQHVPSKKLEEPTKFSRRFISQLSEPIYDTIPELTDSDDCQQRVYALPIDSVKQMVFDKSNDLKTKSNNHDKTSKLFSLNTVSRRASLNTYDQSTDHGNNGDSPEERAKKIKEVERLLKLSLSNETRSSLLSSRGECGNRQNNAYYEATSSNEIALKSLALARKKPHVQPRRIIRPNGKMPLKGTIPRPSSSVIFATDDHKSYEHTNMISYTDTQELLLKQKSPKAINDRKSKEDHQKHVLKEQYLKQQEEAASMGYHTHSYVPTKSQPLPPTFNPPPPPLPPITFNIHTEKKSHVTLNLGKDSLLAIHFITNENINPVSTLSDQLTELKAKHKKDGTRYVTRRTTARANLLKERELVLTRQRTGGMTTDDNAISELKVGKYWPKETRKLHSAQAKQQRRENQSTGIHAV